MSHGKYVASEKERCQNETYHKILTEIRSPKSEEEIDSILSCCDHDLNANLKDNKLMTLLHHAMRSHSFYLARRLVSDYGADVSARSKSGITPLHMLCKTRPLNEKNDSDEEDLEQWARSAVERTKMKRKDKKKFMEKEGDDGDASADQDIISFLVKSGANVNATDYSGSTPLHYTSLYNQPEYARDLIKNGADLECKDIEGMTPFVLAVERDHTSVGKVLLENGADYSAKDNNNNNVLHLCCLNKDHATLGLLSEYLSQVDVNVLRKLLVQLNRFNETPAHYAARREDPSLLQSMLPTTVDPEHIDTKGRNWLHIAAETMEPDIVDVMLEYGIDINSTDNEGDTPLIIAARFGNAAMANKLIQNGAKVNCPNHKGKTPLMIACQTENEHLVESLITNGAELSLLDNQQNSAFYYAIKTRNNNIVSKLLRSAKEKHVILGWKNRNGDTSLHIVASLGDEELIVNLHNEGAYRWALNFCRQTPLHIAASKGHLNDCVLEILNRDNWRDAMWNTAKDLNDEWMTPMRQMIKELPKAALCVLDKCVEQYEEPDDPKSRVVKFDFRFLEQWESYMRSPWTQRPGFLRNCCKSRQKYTHDDITVPFLHSDQVCVLDNRSEPELVHPLRLMLKYNREELFSHPVVQSVLSRMWQPVLGFYLLNMAFFLLFVALFTSFMVLTDPPYLLLGQKSLSTEELCAEMEQNQQKAYHLFVQFPKYALMVASVINIVKEIAQLSASGRSYLTLENLVEWTIFLLAIVTTIDTSACMAKTGLREEKEDEEEVTGSLSLLNELKKTVANLEEAALALHKTILQGK
ncbi:hypothetical protein CRM22_007888 [Opisthorchis felineus]|uniref:Uncharacterized protein n=1 Tax=Opisthorchis felineus TaxID=147828 RepID=A0A4S2LEA2_OPIFE|nr:hypothetical protein CRM22_007888 [Opisthorchis felineus]